MSSEMVEKLILDNLDEIITSCRDEILSRPRLANFAKQLKIGESNVWLEQAVSLFRICLTGVQTASVWHQEMGQINYTMGLSATDADDCLCIIRDKVLRLIWESASRDKSMYEHVPYMVTSVLRSFDSALEAQNSSYIKESQRHLSEINKNLEFRQQTFERDLALARLVQQHFIPKNHMSDYFTAEVRYIPMVGIGGDHAGVYPVSQERMYVTICDVTGHGIASALAAEVVNSKIRPALTQHVDVIFQDSVEPVSVIRDLNELFYSEFQPMGMLLTISIALIDAKKGTITWSGAGHPPPILVRGSKPHDIIELNSQNIILGACDDCVVGEGQTTLPINPADRLIFYTDGIVEACDEAGNMLGIEGLKQIIKKQRRLPTNRMADYIMASAKKVYGENENDDMSLILLDVLDGRETLESRMSFM